MSPMPINVRNCADSDRFVTAGELLYNMYGKHLVNPSGGRIYLSGPVLSVQLYAG